MSKTTLSTKGQITIPKAIRDELGLRPGDELEFVKEDGHFRLEKVVPESPFRKWRGYFQHMKGVDVDEYIEELRGR